MLHEKIFFLITVLMSMSYPLYSSELYIQTGHNSEAREFITLENQGGKYEITVFSQKQGDYQKLEKKSYFDTIEDANKEMNSTYKNFKAIDSLELWPTIYEQHNYITTQNTNDIWPITNTWSVEWEKKYAQWLSLEVTADFFVRYHIAVDCADATIGFRWIFARIHGLPVVNTLAGSGNLFGHFSMRREWQNYPTSPYWYQDQKFIAALNYAMDSTSTRSILLYDGFPVALNTRGLMAGSFIVSYINNSGHLRTITENHFNNPRELPVYTFSATSPREVRNLYREPFVDQAWPIERTREIMAFRWPIRNSNGTWSLNPKNNDFRYSSEQFSTVLPPRYYSLFQYVLENTNPNYEPSGLVTTGITDIKNYANLRIKIVEDGYNFCSRNPCPRDSRAYDDWSTPSRDRSMRLKFIETESLLKTFEPVYPGLMSKWESALDDNKIYVQQTELSLQQLKHLFLNGLISSDPNDSINKRWGM